MVQEQLQKITKETTIGEIVEKYPQVVETLMSFGVHCVGCHVSPFESLEMGFKGHGLDDATIDEAVTKKAAEKIKALITQEKKKGLRISVMPGGCSGYQYGMELDDKAAADDITVEEQGIK